MKSEIFWLRPRAWTSFDKAKTFVPLFTCASNKSFNGALGIVPYTPSSKNKIESLSLHISRHVFKTLLVKGDLLTVCKILIFKNSKYGLVVQIILQPPCCPAILHLQQRCPPQLYVAEPRTPYGYKCFRCRNKARLR
jgi:hypothetical protein